MFSVPAAMAYHACVQELATSPSTPVRGVKSKAFRCRFVNVFDELLDERFDERCLFDLPEIFDFFMLDTRQMSALRRTEPCSRRKRTAFSALFLGV